MFQDLQICGGGVCLPDRAVLTWGGGAWLCSGAVFAQMVGVFAWRMGGGGMFICVEGLWSGGALFARTIGRCLSGSWRMCVWLVAVFVNDGALLAWVMERFFANYMWWGSFLDGGRKGRVFAWVVRLYFFLGGGPVSTWVVPWYFYLSDGLVSAWIVG